jgi:hypothetical protein
MPLKKQGTELENDSPSSSETKGSEGKTPLDPARDPLKQLGEFLRAEQGGAADDAEEQGDDDAGGEPAKKKPKSKPKTLEDLAEALGLEVSALYDVEIPAKAKGAEALKLGKLKDLAAEHGDFTVRQLKLDEDSRSLEALKVQHDQEFREMLGTLPADAIKPEAMDKLRKMLDKRRSEEKELTLETIKEWQDEKVRADDLKGMLAHLESYDIPPAFLVANVSAKLMRFVRDSWKRAETIRKALEQVQERKPRTPAAARSEAGARPAANTGNGRMARTQRGVHAFMATISNHGKR